MVAALALTPALRAEYSALAASCQLTAAMRASTSAGARKILAAAARYRDVESATGVPWAVVGAIHQLESGGAFTRHLHNGDSLKSRTTHTPAGRPAAGSPPFTWEASAADALELAGFTLARSWSLPETLYRLESYNGFGYRLHHPGTLTPYLWAGTTHYTRGKYGADGRWDPLLASQQPGAVALLLALRDLGAVVPVLDSISTSPGKTSPGLAVAAIAAALGLLWTLATD